jgi:hypothetical protein
VLALKDCYILLHRMSSRVTTVEKIPLVETTPGSPCHDLFAAVQDPENEGVYRAIWADFRLELLPRIEALQAISHPPPLRAELHALRGMSAQFGLFLLEIYLFAWEVRTVDPMIEIPRLLPGALAIAARSLEAVEEAFPGLRETEY